MDLPIVLMNGLRIPMILRLNIIKTKGFDILLSGLPERVKGI